MVERASEVSEGLERAMFRRGYVAIGISSFNSGGRESERDAVAHGAKVGADLVLIMDPKYTGSVSSTVPITTPTTTTSYTRSNATAYGSGGVATAYGNSTTTTHGTSTTYIPVTTHRSDYGAIYFVKMKYRIGVQTRPLSDEERRLIGTNRGVAVVELVDGGPAFRADMLPGDIIQSVAGQPVWSPEAFSKLSDTVPAGSPIELGVYRAGESRVVRLDP